MDADSVFVGAMPGPMQQREVRLEPCDKLSVLPAPVDCLVQSSLCLFPRIAEVANQHSFRVSVWIGKHPIPPSQLRPNVRITPIIMRDRISSGGGDAGIVG